MASNRPADIECVNPFAIIVPFAPSRLCMPEIVLYHFHSITDSNTDIDFQSNLRRVFDTHLADEMC